MRSSWQVRVGIVGLVLLGACGDRAATRSAATSGGEAARHEDERRVEGTPATGTGDTFSFDSDQVEAPAADGADGSGSAPPPADQPTAQRVPTVMAQSESEAVEAAPPSYSDDMSLSVGTSTTSSTGMGSTTLDLPNIGGYGGGHEPSPIELVGYALAPSVPTRVLLGTLELPPGERLVPPVSSCQDTLLYVASGELAASGTGIASVDSPITLYAGDAVRFGPEGDGLVVNTSSETVRTIVALARSEDGGPARIALEERGDRVLCPDHGSSDPLSQPQRVASFATSPPLMVVDGALEVRILLDADASGAEHAGLAILSASPSFAVPEHTHDEAAEILYFEDGRGTMWIGDHAIDVAPGVSVYVPEGTPHSFEPSGTRPMRALQFYAPSGPEQRFRGMAEGG